jgi:hypothetical protein
MKKLFFMVALVLVVMSVSCDVGELPIDEIDVPAMDTIVQKQLIGKWELFAKKSYDIGKLETPHGYFIEFTGNDKFIDGLNNDTTYYVVSSKYVVWFYDTFPAPNSVQKYTPVNIIGDINDTLVLSNHFFKDTILGNDKNFKCYFFTRYKEIE